jgi:glycosyltransferase involved in cell wall biosynthesis
MILSILIATLESRIEQFTKLEDFLNKQIADNNLSDDVEVLYFRDDKEYPIGVKRNTLLENASGLFTVFVDDDDWVADDYVSTIVTALKSNSDIDCIGIKGELISEDLGNKPFIHSVHYKMYFEDANYYYRPPNHLNPIKKEIATQIKFPLKNFGEDYDWAMALLESGLLQTEIFIDKILYYYHFAVHSSETFGSR